MPFQWPGKKRIAWLVIAIALMFMSSYSIFRWFGDVGLISGWTGLPEYEAKIPELQREAEVWFWVTIVSPFIAAFLLGLGRNETWKLIKYVGPAKHLLITYSDESREWLAPIVSYLLRLGVSALGTLGFSLLLLLVGFVLYKLGVHAG